MDHNFWMGGGGSPMLKLIPLDGDLESVVTIYTRYWRWFQECGFKPTRPKKRSKTTKGCCTSTTTEVFNRNIHGQHSAGFVGINPEYFISIIIKFNVVKHVVSIMRSQDQALDVAVLGISQLSEVFTDTTISAYNAVSMDGTTESSTDIITRHARVWDMVDTDIMAMDEKTAREIASIFSLYILSKRRSIEQRVAGVFSSLAEQHHSLETAASRCIDNAIDVSEEMEILMFDTVKYYPTHLCVWQCPQSMVYNGPVAVIGINNLLNQSISRFVYIYTICRYPGSRTDLPGAGSMLEEIERVASVEYECSHSVLSALDYRVITTTSHSEIKTRKELDLVCWYKSRGYRDIRVTLGGQNLGRAWRGKYMLCCIADEMEQSQRNRDAKHKECDEHILAKDIQPLCVQHRSRKPHRGGAPITQ